MRNRPTNEARAAIVYLTLAALLLVIAARTVPVAHGRGIGHELVLLCHLAL